MNAMALARRIPALLMSLILLTGSAVATDAPPAAPAEVKPLAPPKPGPSRSAAARQAAKRLRREGFSAGFIRRTLAAYDESRRDSIVALNVLGFLVNQADYAGHFSPRAVRATAEYLAENQPEFDRASRRHGVSREVIASLLWVETKYGRVIGRESVVGAYFSLIQAGHRDVIRATMRALAARVPKVTSEHRKKVRERSRKKAQWALKELRALAKLEHEGKVDLLTLRGSFAGAFGLPQFLPSSYLRWSRASRRGRPPDLFRADDAIHSVAYYLKAHGWRARSRRAQWHALHGYNNSAGYVNVILRLAGCVRAQVSGAEPPIECGVSVASPGSGG